MKDKNFMGMVLNVVDETAIQLGLMLLLSCFIAALFAPAFQCFLETPILKRMAKSTILEEQIQLTRERKLLRKILWGIAVFAWGLLLWVNVATDNLNFY